MKIEIDAPSVRDEEDLADVLRNVAKMVRDGFTSGISLPPGVHWDTSGDYAESEEEDES